MRKLKIIAVLVTIILAVGMLASCGAAQIEKPEILEGVTPVDVTGYCEMEVDGTTITVTGETDFIAGTIIHISIAAQSGEEIDSVTISKSQYAISQTFQITDENFGDDVKSFTAFITVAPKQYGKQTDNVYAQYGKKFERISSEHIWNKDGILVIFASETFDR